MFLWWAITFFSKLSRFAQRIVYCKIVTEGQMHRKYLLMISLKLKWMWKIVLRSEKCCVIVGFCAFLGLIVREDTLVKGILKKHDVGLRLERAASENLTDLICVNYKSNNFKQCIINSCIETGLTMFMKFRFKIRLFLSNFLVVFEVA